MIETEGNIIMNSDELVEKTIVPSNVPLGFFSRVKEEWYSLPPKDRWKICLAILGIGAAAGTATVCYTAHETTTHGYELEADFAQRKFSYKPSDRNSCNVTG